MEELDYVWLEEPFHEQKMEQYRELCGVLTIPVMSNETLMHDMVLSAQWLVNGQPTSSGPTRVTEGPLRF